MGTIDKASLEGRTLYFMGANNKIVGVTEAAIVHLVNEHTRHKIRMGMYLTKEEAELKLKELKEGAE